MHFPDIDGRDLTDPLRLFPPKVDRRGRWATLGRSSAGTYLRPRLAGGLATILVVAARLPRD